MRKTLFLLAIMLAIPLITYGKTSHGGSFYESKKAKAFATVKYNFLSENNIKVENKNVYLIFFAQENSQGVERKGSQVVTPPGIVDFCIYLRSDKTDLIELLPENPTFEMWVDDTKYVYPMVMNERVSRYDIFDSAYDRSETLNFKYDTTKKRTEVRMKFGKYVPSSQTYDTRISFRKDSIIKFIIPLNNGEQYLIVVPPHVVEEWSSVNQQPFNKQLRRKVELIRG
jgi:hypothetical protein